GREGDIGGLGAAELPPGLLDVPAVLIGRRAHVPGLTNRPAQRRHPGPPLLVVASKADRELESGGRRVRQVLEFQECGPLFIAEADPPEVERASPPVREGGVRRTGLGRSLRPFWEILGWRRLVPPQPAFRKAHAGGSCSVDVC